MGFQRQRSALKGIAAAQTGHDHCRRAFGSSDLAASGALAACACDRTLGARPRMARSMLCCPTTLDALAAASPVALQP